MTGARSLRFVTMVGSLRKKSYNAIIARALPSLAPAGISIDPLGSISEVPIYDSDAQEQGFPEAVTVMGESITTADGLIFVTPEYNYSVPGGIKNALDWLSRLPTTPLKGKPVAIQTASPSMIGGARCQYHLRQILVFLDAFVLNKPEVMVNRVENKIDADTGVIHDADTMDILARQLDAFASFVRRFPLGDTSQ